MGRINWRVPRSWEISKEAIRTHEEEKDNGLNWGIGSKDGKICFRREVGKN